MNPLRFACLFMGILTIASANSRSRALKLRSNNNSIKNGMKASDWLSVSELEALPSMHDMSIKKLEEMPLPQGAELIRRMYHLSRAGDKLEPTYVPDPNQIPAIYVTPDNKKKALKLKDLPKLAKEEKDFGDEEVTIFITGLPETTETVKKATHKLMQAYMERYNRPAPKPDSNESEADEDDKENSNASSSSSEEKEENSQENALKKPLGNLIVIELGNMLDDMQKQATLDVERTGMEIGDILVKLTDKADVPHEIIHVIGSNVGAHIAGAAGRHFTRETGHKLRRITGLDPSKIYARPEKTLSGLARGDAEFVDVIHTSAHGMGTASRNGDADFYPNGPSEGVPGADNVVEATMRAVRYFAESVIPGNERNFPAVGGTSLNQYKEKNGNGKRVYMGIDTDSDAKGDFMLKVNPKSPFGRSAPAEKQQNYHNLHKPWKMEAESKMVLSAEQRL